MTEVLRTPIVVVNSVHTQVHSPFGDLMDVKMF